jgi:hypothetical protein
MGTEYEKVINESISTSNNSENHRFGRCNSHPIFGDSILLRPRAVADSLPVSRTEDYQNILGLLLAEQRELFVMLTDRLRPKLCSNDMMTDRRGDLTAEIRFIPECVLCRKALSEKKVCEAMLALHRWWLLASGQARML